MSVGTETESEIVVQNGSWVSGMLAGIAGSVVMAAAMLVMGALPVLAGAIPGLYTLAPRRTPPPGSSSTSRTARSSAWSSSPR